MKSLYFRLRICFALTILIALAGASIAIGEPAAPPGSSSSGGTYSMSFSQSAFGAASSGSTNYSSFNVTQILGTGSGDQASATYDMGNAIGDELPLIAEISDDSATDGASYTGPTPTLSQGDLPVTYSLSVNPTGMTIDSGTGVVSWPNATYSGSPHTITIQATNNAGSDEESWLLTVNPVLPQINTISDDSVTDGASYTGPTPSLSQGTLPTTWSLSANPAGMTIDSGTGVVSWANAVYSGSPHTITIQATNAAGSDEESWLLTVDPVLPQIQAFSDDSVDEGLPYTGPTPSLSQGTLPVIWSLSANPSGMTIDSGTGVVSWPSPAAFGSPHTITIQATNDGGSDEESWLLTVNSVGSPPDSQPTGIRNKHWNLYE